MVAARIENGCFSDRTIPDLAAEIGISERHFRRIVQIEFGVSPVALAQTQRLHIAKRLLTDSYLPITEIAYAAGFNSVRRFNALFSERYRLNPSEMRRNRKAVPETSVLRCALSYRPPMDWRGIIDFLEQRAIPGVERVHDGIYHRTVCADEHRGWLSAAIDETRNCIVVSISHSLIPAVMQVLTRTRRLFDLCADPVGIANQIGELAATNPGARVPGAYDGFEMAVRAICGQQITVRGATAVSGRIAEAFGEPLIDCPVEGLTHYWPIARIVAEQSKESLVSCGLIGRRAESIIELSKAVAAQTVVLEPGVDIERTMKLLNTIPGIGEWTSQYIAMRALGWPDAFPHSDLGLMKALRTTDARLSLKIAEQWRPWRAYAAVHLWRLLEEKK
jgi:AraC family transcriptional regulator of adaptative response / DNA-3-methyladenine glycosylase II